MNRRQFVLSTAAVAVADSLIAAEAKPAFSLDPLPYAKDALEPHIDAMTMEIHHGKHHQAYVTKLNEALASDPSFVPGSLVELQKKIATAPESIRTALRNNGGGHFNHKLFWESLSKTGGGEPTGALAAKINESFGDLAKFKAKFADHAMKRFGSGWAWLIQRADGKLAVASTPNQDNPLMTGIVYEEGLGTPLLGLDVWEHAYYLHYQNRRADYVTAFWNVVDWKAVAARLAAA